MLLKRVKSHTYWLHIAFLLAVACPALARAQATLTASKSMDISPFGGYTYVRPDFGPKNNNGMTAGIDFTRYFLGWPVAPSLELRGTYTSGPSVKERTVSGGIRVQRQFRSFTPYVDFLYGIGTIIYAVDPIPGYREDRGPVLTYGAGLNYRLPANFELMVDFQEQNWNLGINGVLKPQGGNFTLSPTALTVGVTYHIPFRSYVGSRIHKMPPMPPQPPPPPPGAATAAPPAPPDEQPAQQPAQPSATTAPADTTTQPAPATQPDTTTPPPTTPPDTTPHA